MLPNRNSASAGSGHHVPAVAAVDATVDTQRSATPRMTASRSNTDPTVALSRGTGAAARAHVGQHELETIHSKAPLAAATKTDSVDDAATSAAASTSVRLAKPSLRDRLGHLRPELLASNKRRRQMHGMLWKEKAKARVAAAYQSVIIEGLLRRKPLPPSRDGRHIPMNHPDSLVDERSSRHYCSNFIRSSRYTVYDFVPKQLLFQFSKLGNFYFLVMGILQTIPGLSTVGQWTTIGPLLAFVAFSMAKEGLDDYRRYQLDKSENRSNTLVLSRNDGRKRKPAHMKTAMKRIKYFNDKDEVAVEEIALGDVEQSPANSDWVELDWQQVRVGDIVRLQRDEDVPADMVLLHATGPNSVAYIETMALDGETNLKAKQACPPLAERCATVDGLRKTQATIVSEDPNIDLYSYDGRVVIGSETLPLTLNNVVYRGSTLRNTSEAIGLVVNSGEECKIRMNAHKNVRTKKPAMQSAVNKIIFFQIFIVVMLAVGFTIGYYLWEEDVENKSFYLYRKGVYDAAVPFREIFFGFLIMFNTLIPLSLYISLEIVKLGQLLLLHDADMYDPVSDTPMVANTTTILENLGQISYVFSDKTGTLTENLMRFRKLSVAGVSVLHDMDVLRDERAKQDKLNTYKTSKKRGRQQANAVTSAEPVGRTSTGSLTHWKSSVRPNDEPDMKTEELLEYIHLKPNTAFSRKAKHFLLCIALCHTCLPESKDDGSIHFQAASPDELALVEAAQDLEYLVIDRPAQTIKLQIKDAEGNKAVESYQVLDVIEFSSLRKRMSIIVRMPDKTICVICKGADNVITSRLKLSHLAEQKARDIGHRASMRKTFEKNKALQRMSMQMSARSTPRNSLTIRNRDSTDFREGLRQSIGRRSVDGNRLGEGQSSWLQRRRTEEMATPRHSVDLLKSNRRSLSRVASFDAIDRRVDESIASSDAAIFERCFQHVDDFATEGLRTLLYGYRYIDEDTYAKWKAQYREAETSLVDRQQRIEVAGDLIEHKFDLAGATAIEDKLQDGVPETIDKLTRANIKVWMLTGDKRETAINIAHSAHVCKPYSELYILDANAAGALTDQLTMTLTDVSRGMAPHTVLVVDGQTLTKIDADDELSILFYDLVIRVDSIICCRASPSQKAELVKAIRRYVPGSMTLAIGDGANDIGMIQASHVGIGISGREGLQAARISDYSIAQFRFLQKLLFVHGRWNYLRTGKYVLATFWKEIFFYLLQAHFQRFTGYTGTSLFQSTSIAMFNTLFTSLAVILPGIFERDLRAETLLAVPELYTFGQRNKAFNYRLYIGWMLMGIASSFIVYYITWAVYNSALFTEDTSLYAMGTICFTVGVIFINTKLFILELHSKTVITFAGYIITIGGWFIWLLILNKLMSASMNVYLVHDAFTRNFGTHLGWWTTLLVALTGPIMLELVVQGVRRVYWPTDTDLMQRMEKDADVLEIQARFDRDPEAHHTHASDDEQVIPDDHRGGRAGLGAAKVSQELERGAAVPGRFSLSDTPRRPPAVRASLDEYRPSQFTPLTEEQENPSTKPSTKLERIRDD
ncbi:ATPase, P-type, phospholipid-translocating, flippase [Cordyceps fumosorosea ARSEF 2679]|uniref:Phospholipid-transporting ATPase n=1 Tax=Cordyceps fumosorosea (strain ARSEF 2679) TaxID=1081104 RepID=A0A167M369_CORFA|nr:ATPase, P-type, phospholipid-translocating, flippase [Cordyceps fumosorosea ARSEF 2679]OAA53859.1 ATPase, P-type, phospholipid-translocating, flippase [Cordyceps fumosorosea ARSEF 2679]